VQGVARSAKGSRPGGRSRTTGPTARRQSLTRPRRALQCAPAIPAAASSSDAADLGARAHPAPEGHDRVVTRVPIWHSVDEVPAELGPTAVSIGNYDGVHRGHRFVLDQLRRHAQARSLAPVALTFWPHPRPVAADPARTPLLTGHEDRDR